MTNGHDGSEDQLGEAVRHRGAGKQGVLASVVVLLLAVAALGGYLIGESGGEGPTVEALTNPGDGSDEDTALGSYFPTGSVAGSLRHLFTRDTNGIAIRAYESSNPQSSVVIAEMSNDAAISYGTLFSCGDGPIVISGGIAGVGEGSPFAWVVVRLQAEAASATSVRVDFGPSHDEMQPVDGIAALAGPAVDMSSEALDGAVEALDSEGRTIAAIPLGTLARPTECAPSLPPTTAPATLPPASGPPPADEDAARDGVIQAFVEFSTSGNPREVRLAAVEDADVIGPLLDQARAAGLRAYGSAIDNMTVTVGEIRFIDEAHAAAITTLHIPGHADVYPNTLETAVFVDGRWKLTRETICTRMAPSGAICPPA